MRTRQVVLAAAAGILLMVAVVIQLGGPHVKVNEQTLGLVTEHKRFARDLIGSIISAHRLRSRWRGRSATCGAARARATPTLKPRFVGIIAVAGCVLSAVSVVAYITGYGIQAHHFVTHGSQTYPRGQRAADQDVVGDPAAHQRPRLAPHRGRTRAGVDERDAGRPAHPLPGLSRDHRRHPHDHPGGADPDHRGVLAAGARVPDQRTVAERRAAGLDHRPRRALAGQAAPGARRGNRCSAADGPSRRRSPRPQPAAAGAHAARGRRPPSASASAGISAAGGRIRHPSATGRIPAARGAASLPIMDQAVPAPVHAGSRDRFASPAVSGGA